VRDEHFLAAGGAGFLAGAGVAAAGTRVVFLDLALFAFWLGCAVPWLFGVIRLGDAVEASGP